MKPRRPAFAALLNPLSLLLFISIVSVAAQAQAQKSGTTISALPDYLSAQESEVINEINLARTRPQEYIAYLEQLKKYYAGNVLSRPGQMNETTNEGVRAVDEAIQFMRAIKPLPPLSVAKGMCMAARDHIKDMEKSNGAGHTGSDGTIPEQRLSRYGSWNDAVGENIAYSSTTARDIVLGWIVDDGTPSRGHRKAIFNAGFASTGIALGKSQTYGPLCVSVFTGSFREKAGAGATPSSAQPGKPAARKF